MEREKGTERGRVRTRKGIREGRGINKLWRCTEEKKQQKTRNARERKKREERMG